MEHMSMYQQAMENYMNLKIIPSQYIKVYKYLCIYIYIFWKQTG